MSDVSPIDEYVRSQRQRYEEELFEFLRIPSVSTQSRHKEDVRRCAEWVAEKTREAGVSSVELVETPGHPIVLGEHHVDDAAPTLLIYGHYDVQPVDPEDLWDSPPFEPTIRGDRVYARGASDDKGQVYMHLKALEACRETGGGLPVNVKLLIEGEEEIGSENIEAFVVANRDRLACDAVILSDTGMFEKGLPSITVGLRGMLYFEVRFSAASSDLHSGEYGGTVENPANALATVIGRLKDEAHRVTVPGFYDDVRPITEQERANLASLPFDDAHYLEELGAPALVGEEGFGTLERAWFRPTLDVNGLLSGFTGEGAKTVLPCKAMAKISMRLVPDQSPETIRASFESWIRELAPEGVEVEVDLFNSGQPWAADPKGPLFTTAAEAFEEVFGRAPVFIREGGSIPIVPLFEQTLDVPVAPIGFALPGCNLHAPNEWLDLEVYHDGIDALARMYSLLGERGLED
jgi:acetylornithine deacetylase/succinyl-diaminopimelate desuccinylase-like protein